MAFCVGDTYQYIVARKRMQLLLKQMYCIVFNQNSCLLSRTETSTNCLRAFSHWTYNLPYNAEYKHLYYMTAVCKKVAFDCSHYKVSLTLGSWGLWNVIGSCVFLDSNNLCITIICSVPFSSTIYILCSQILIVYMVYM